MENNKGRKRYIKWFRRWRKMLIIFMGIVYPFRIKGLQTKFTGTTYIYVCNHYRVWDLVYPCIATKDPIHFMAKQSLWKRGIVKYLAIKSECIPVNRDGNDIKAVIQAMRYLKNGENVGIFPEGTRNKSNDIFLPFKGGASALSIKTKTPIVPIVQMGKARLFRKTDVVYGHPIEFSEYYDKRITEEDIEKCDRILLETMLKMREDNLDAKKKKR